ncbi:ASCH domain-containing protein [Bacteroides congonensis]|uniref:ASCH domain-containing protein n=1 Tax=Bacteroides congonensis TaxID=1871006 RepID=UPI00321B836F
MGTERKTEKMLILPIEKKWLDMILSGEKGEEYREIKPYWTVRIVRWLGFPASETESVLELLRKQETARTRLVILQNGYGRNAPKIEIMCSLSIGTGKAEWGAAPGKEYYRFHIKSIAGKE